MILRRNIEDLPHNMTRFLVVGREQADRRPGSDKTSLLLVTRDEPGILYRVLGAFAQRGLNMSKIESRPVAAPALGVRVLRRHRRPRSATQPVAAALADLRASCETLKVLGSYPRAEMRPAAPAARAVIANGSAAPASGRKGCGFRPVARDFLNAVAELATARRAQGPAPRRPMIPSRQMGKIGPRRRQRPAIAAVVVGVARAMGFDAAANTTAAGAIARLARGRLRAGASSTSACPRARARR